MMEILAALIPIFAIIITGYLLRRNAMFGEDTWVAVGNICYFVLFPCLLIKTLSTANLSELNISGLSIAMAGTIVVSSALLVMFKGLLSSLLAISDAAFTSVHQSITRWHGFMAMAIVTGLYGEPGITIIALGIAVMVPLINVLNVIVLSIWGDDKGHSVGAKSVIMNLIRNPFIVACLVGVLINVSGLQLPKMIIDTMSIMSGGALGLSLLAIGAGLKLAQIQSTKGVMVFSVGFRLLGMPAIMILLTSLLGIDGMEQTVAVIATAVPTAASSYVLAQKMGGDVVLMANVIALQVLAAAITLPLAILAAEAF